MNAYDVTLKTPDITLHFHIQAETPDKAIADVQAFARWRDWLKTSVIADWKPCSNGDISRLLND